MVSSSDHRDDVASPDWQLAEIVDRVEQQLRTGEQLDIQRLVEEYPEHADELRELCQVMRALDPASQGSDVDSGSHDTPHGIPQVLGDYRILHEVGRGGMGVVYEARQVSLNRRVALKVLPFAAMFDQRQLQRFRNEATAAASLHHENIVPVHALASEGDVHFYAMQFIDGKVLSQVVRELRSGNVAARHHDTCDTSLIGDGSDKGRRAPDALSAVSSSNGKAYFRSIATLGKQVAEALDHAHQRGVLHRDIKPSNLILDEDGKAWVTDFGLAHLEHGTNLTMTGDLLGTLRYMSPEQTRSKRNIVDHRTDIYSLGVTLYELITLEPAFPAADRQELLQQITDSTPLAPRQLNRHVPHDLETIVLKAMSKEPEERYSTAESLAQDLDRLLSDKPVHAKRPTTVQRAAKWAKRHSLAVAVGFVVVTILAVALAANTFWISHLYTVSNENARRAHQKQLEAARAATWLRIERGTRSIEAGDASGLLDIVEAMALSAELPQYRQLPHAWAMWHARFAGHLARVVGHAGPVNALAIHPNGQTLATAADDGTVRLWGLPDGRPLGQPLLTGGAAVEVTFSSDGRFLAAGLADGMARLWRTEDYSFQQDLRHGEGAIRTVRFSPDTTLVATGSEGDEYARVWNIGSGQPLEPRIPQKADEHHLYFAPDGSFLSVSNSPFDFGLWTLTPTIRRQRRIMHNNSVRFAPVLDGGRRVLTVSIDRILRLWNVNPATSLETSLKCTSVISRVALDDEERRVAIGTVDGTVRIWDLVSDEVMDLAKTHTSYVNAIAFSRDGQFLATGSSDGTGQVWDVESGEPWGPVLRHQDGITEVAFDVDGQLLVSASRDGTVRFWDVGFRAPVIEFPDGSGDRTIRFSPDGELLAAASKNSLNLWKRDGSDYRPYRSMEDVDDILAFEFHPHGAIVSTATARHTVRRWDVATGDRVGNELVHPDWVAGLAYRPDGNRLATGTSSAEKTVRIYAAESEKPEYILPVPGGVASLAFDPTGTRLACGTHSGLLLLRDPTNEQPGPGTQLVDLSVTSLAFDRGGERLVVGLRGPAALIVEASSLQTLGPTLRHDGRVTSVAFSPDGALVATASRDGRARIWHGWASSPYCVSIDHPSSVRGVAFSPDGRLLATSCEDDRLRLWPIPPAPRSLADARRRTALTLGAELGLDDQPEAIPWQQWQRLTE